jgi:hypothetical protein
MRHVHNTKFLKLVTAYLHLHFWCKIETLVPPSSFKNLAGNGMAYCGFSSGFCYAWINPADRGMDVPSTQDASGDSVFNKIFFITERHVIVWTHWEFKATVLEYRWRDLFEIISEMTF